MATLSPGFASAADKAALSGPMAAAPLAPSPELVAFAEAFVGSWNKVGWRLS
jgi:hypothetical protein